MIPCASNAASPSVRESKTVVDSGFHEVDSGSQTFAEFQILKAEFRIPQAKNRAVMKGGGRGISLRFHEYKPLATSIGK